MEGGLNLNICFSRRVVTIALVVGVCLFCPLQQVAAMPAATGQFVLPGIGGLAIPDWLTASPAKGLEKQTETGQQYDLTGLSGDAWRYARIVVYRLEQNLGPAALLFGLVESNPMALGELARPLLEKKSGRKWRKNTRMVASPQNLARWSRRADHVCQFDHDRQSAAADGSHGICVHA